MSAGTICAAARSQRRSIGWASMEPPPLASVDGSVVPVAEAVIPVTDEGLLRGDGAFEVLRLYGGPALRLRCAPRPHAALGRQPAPALRPRRRGRRRARAARGGGAGRCPAAPRR